jgi:CRISPR-associated exonuclease Cas4
VAFADLARAAYCPRQLYYARREESREIPPQARRIRALAFAYPDLLEAPAAALADRPIALSPATYRCRLRALREREDWAGLVDPPEREVRVHGKDCRGRVDKVLDGPIPVLVSPGEPPDRGVWEPQSVRAVAAAKALAWRAERPVERALVEYPAHAVVREVRLTTRRKAGYRRTLRTVRKLDGPPPRIANDAKCDACDYREECGVRTRTLGSLLFG